MSANRIWSIRELKDFLSYEKKQYGLKEGLISTIKRKISGNEIDAIWKFQRRLRLTEYYKNCGHVLFYRISQLVLNRLQNRYGLHIRINTCGKGLKIMHLGPILVNGRAQIGNNCALHINTSIVAQGVSDDVPIISDDVVIGVGAVVLGNVFIAKGIAIGANAVVNKSFYEEGIAIAGVPARKISNNGRYNWNKNEEKRSDYKSM